jgi:hypothetical protein
VREHPDTEVLSSYLDSELPPPEAGRLQEHLRTCAPCAERLGALRHTVARLRTLARPVPPAAIVEELRVRLPGARRPPAWRERLERLVRTGLVLQPAVTTGFALVVALAVIVYFHTYRAQPRRPTTLVVPPVEVREPPAAPAAGRPAAPAVGAPAAAAPKTAAPPAASRDAIGESADAAPPPPAAAEQRRRAVESAAALAARRQEPPLEQRVAERIFELRQEVWVERGLDPAAPVLRVAASSDIGRQLLERFPELARLLRSGAVRLATEGRVLEIERPRAEPP